MKQRTTHDCVITSLCYLTDYEYDFLKEKIGSPASFENVIIFLNTENIKYNDFVTSEGLKHFYDGSFNSECYTNNNKLLNLLENKKGLFAVHNVFNYHCVAFKNNEIFEPTIGKIKQYNEYEILRVLVIDESV